MSGSPLRKVLDCLRARVGPPAAAGAADGQLLERWVGHRDEAAFELLLRRHGPMVFGLCRRMLGNRQDAEDAFQAVFLVLATKARSIGKRDAVGSWLYKIALRVALRCRTRTARHGCAALDGVSMPAPAQPDAVMWHDTRRVLDEEIGRLPERYRSVFVLCHLEGKSNAEAARECGLPLGTVVSRLARARERLRSRLTRRGVTLSAGLLAAGLSQEAAAAHLPGVLVVSTMKAILWGAAEPAVAAGLLTAQAATLTKGVLHAMWLTKIKLTAASVLSVALIGSGGVATYRTVAAGPGDGFAQAQEQGAGAKSNAPQQESQRDKDIVGLQRSRFVLRMENAELKARLQKLEAELASMRADQALVKNFLTRSVGEAQTVADGPRAARMPPPRPNPNVSGDVVEAAQNEVELLRAKLLEKRAGLSGTQASVRIAERELAYHKELVASKVASQSSLDVMAEKLNKAKAEHDAAIAGVQIAEVQLQQAQRRFARLQEPANVARNPAPANVVQQLRQIESQLDGLRQQTEQLRRQLENAEPRRPPTQ